MTEECRMYNRMMEVFTGHISDEEEYDVDMFRKDICDSLFIETDPQDIDEDEFVVFQEALILLVRDDQLLNWFGLAGLCILHADLIHDGENYYVNKTCWKEDEPDFMTALKETMGEEEY